MLLILVPAKAMPANADAGLTGLVVVDKEPGWTSHDVVARCRRIFSQRRVGHAGTLDPDASGVLLVGLGRFTRMLRFVQSLQKSYVGEVVLGTSTSTLDSSGDVTGTWDMSAVSLEDAVAAAKQLTGNIQQVPPMVSAIKVDGTRLHELARQGIEIDRKPRWVTVDRFDVFEVPGSTGVFRIEVDCSTGTYVRSLAADLGTALSGGAHLRALRRLKVGSFGDAESHRLDELVPQHILTPAQGLRDLQRLEAGAETARRVAHGLPIDRTSFRETGATAIGPGPYAVVDHSGRLLAVYESGGADRIVAACVLAS
ncbi:MAG: tRNA pseudouridine(55) synthase TruB [Acidimicrobiales bacterium]